MKRIAIAGIAFLGLTAGCDAPPATGPDETTPATDVVEAATNETVVSLTLDCHGISSQFAALPELAQLTGITLTATATPAVTRRWSTSLIDDGPVYTGAILFDGTRFLAMGGDGDCALCDPFAGVWESTDGTSWNQIARIGGIPGWRDVIYTGARYVAGGNGFDNRLWVSEDGTTWMPEPGGEGYALGIQSFAWDGDRTVVVLGTLRLGYSVDGGAAFTPISQVLFDNAWYNRGVIWDGHQFIAYFAVPRGYPGYPGTMIATSPDGIQWMEHHTHQSALPMALIWMATDGAGRFLAYDNLNRKAMSSTDGLHWTPAPASVPTGRRFAWDAGEVVAYSPIYTSVDELNWRQECGGELYAYHMASGNGRRVIVGTGYQPGGRPFYAAASDLTKQPYAELSLEMRTYAPNTSVLLSRQLLGPTDARDPRLAPGSTIAFPPFIAGRVASFIMQAHAEEGSAILSGAFDVRVRYREIGGG